MSRDRLIAYGEMLEQLNILKSADYASCETEVVKGLTFNSKEVEPGMLFVCKGLQFKEDYLQEALDRGAIGYVSEEKYDVGESVPSLTVTNIRLAMAHMADYFYDSPSKKIQLIGVTGTKGKTTTTHYIKEILDEHLKAQGKKECGLVSSFKVVDGQAEESSTMTTPESITLQRHIANAVEPGLEYMVIEVSSQALKYHRVECLEFDVGIFLNISLDHISPYEHENYEDYFQSKVKLFDQSRIAVVNADAQEFENVLPYAKEAEEVVTYSLKNPEADYYGVQNRSNEVGSSFRLKAPEFNEHVHLGMIGVFNIENAVAAIAATTKLGVSMSSAKASLREVKVPGRMEIRQSQDGLLTTIVDYAHNKVSYEALFSTLRRNHPEKYIVAIFGMIGDRAFNRRREVGEVVSKYADEAILTLYNPGSESPEDLIDPIAEDLEKNGTPYKILEDRSKAIKEAIFTTDKETIVVLAGRGHEDLLEVNGEYVKMPTDSEYVDRYMAEYEAMQINR